MSKKLFVGNLPYSLSGDQLKEMFSKYGQIDSVYIPVDKERGRPSGIAFVEFNVDTQAMDALKEMDGTEIGGRAIVVQEARPKPDRGADGRRPQRNRGFNDSGHNE